MKGKLGLMEKPIALLFLVLQVGCASQATLVGQPSKAIEPEQNSKLPIAEVPQGPSALGSVDNNEWRGKCRKFVNEANQALKNKGRQRLQNRYRFDGSKIYWSVLTFGDGECHAAIAGDRYIFNCKGDPFIARTKCVQVAHQSLMDDHWVNRTLPSTEVMQIEYSAKKSANVVTLTSVGESEDEHTEQLWK